MSWGYRVIIILVLFVAGILFMVYVATQQNVEMMDDHYYEKEVEYQGIIDARKNLERFNDSISVTGEGNVVKVQIPVKASGNITEGYLEFLKQDNKSKDVRVTIATDTSGVQLLPKSDFVTGYYRLRARWKSAGVDYYDERNVRIP